MSYHDWDEIRRDLESRYGEQDDDDVLVAMHAIDEGPIRIEGFWWAEPDPDLLRQLQVGMCPEAAGLAVGFGEPPVTDATLHLFASDDVARHIVELLPKAPGGRLQIGPQQWREALEDPRQRTALGQIDVCSGAYRERGPRLGLGFTWVDLPGDGRYYVEKGSTTGVHAIDTELMMEIIDSLIRRVRAGEMHGI